MSESIEKQFKKNWSEVECWAWDDIHSGRIADFNTKFKINFNPKKLKGEMTKTIKESYLPHF